MTNEIIESEIVYRGHFVNVRIDTVKVGDKIVQREIVEESGDGVLIAPITDDHRVMLIPQKRHLYGTVYEVPSGAMKKGEKTLDAAKRELLEETGIEADAWQLMSTHAHGVHMLGLNHYYLASGLNFGKDTSFDMDEEIEEAKPFTFAQIDALIKENKIPDIRNRGCLWLAKLTLLEKGLTAKDLK